MSMSYPRSTYRPFALRSILVNDGDSLLQFTGGAFGTTSMVFCTDALKLSFVVGQNVSAGGATAETLLANFAANVAPYYQSTVPFVVHLLVGGNDIRAGDSAATLKANIKSYVNLVHALGANAKIAVSTYPLQCDLCTDAGWNATTKAFNDDLIATWNLPQGLGGYGADALLNYFADPTIGANNYVTSAFCDPAYSADGHHGNDIVKQIMGQIEAEAVRPLL